MAGPYTRCPGCDSVYRLTAQQLAGADGTVRCGTCGKTFSAIAHLFADHPARDESPLERPGVPPLLRHPAVAQPQLPGLEGQAEPERHEERGPTLKFPETNDDGARSSSPAQLACLLLGLALFGQAIVQWQSSDSALSRWLNPGAATSDGSPGVEALQITSRDMHRHPSLDDAVIISATLRHRGSNRRPWPLLEVRLYDPSQQILGARRLEPIDYLGDADAVNRGMAPDVLTPIILEFVVGTTEPSGFDFRFF